MLATAPLCCNNQNVSLAVQIPLNEKHPWKSTTAADGSRQKSVTASHYLVHGAV